jgi:manganese/zinc/iron transport system permease protein
MILDYSLTVVAAGSAILGVLCGVLGTFASVKKESLLADGISHATLPGAILAFIVVGNKNTGALLFGAFLFGGLAKFWVLRAERNPKISFDSALAISLSSFFGLGIVLLSWLQKFPNSSQAGLDRFLFGQSSAQLLSDVIFISVLCVIIIIIAALFWKEIETTLFDPVYAECVGFAPKRVNQALSALTVLGIVAGAQIVGVVLMCALLITPAATARMWSSRLSTNAVLASVIGAVSGALGTVISASVEKAPAGPSIVIVASALAAFSFILKNALFPRAGEGGV